TAISSKPATTAGASRTAHNLPITTRGPPRPALLRYVGLRAAGLGSLKGVVLGCEKGVGVRCDLTFWRESRPLAHRTGAQNRPERHPCRTRDAPDRSGSR